MRAMLPNERTPRCTGAIACRDCGIDGDIPRGLRREVLGAGIAHGVANGAVLRAGAEHLAARLIVECGGGAAERLH